MNPGSVRKTPIRILLNEDEPSDILLLEKELRKPSLNYELRIVDNEQDFVSTLREFDPDIILSDYSLPAFSGPEAFRVKQQIKPITPFIIVSGSIGEEKAVELIKKGATDCVLKDRLYTLNSKIERALKEAAAGRERELLTTVLQKSELKFRQLMEATPDALIAATSEGKIIYANQQISFLFGYTNEELVGQQVEILMPPRFAVRHKEHRSGYSSKGHLSRAMGTLSMPVFGRRKDGSEFPADISLKSIDTEDGLLIVTIIRDITEKEKAQTMLDQSLDQLRESDEIQRAVIRTIPASVAVVSQNGRLVKVNDSWKKFGELRGLPADFNWLNMNYFEVIESIPGTVKSAARQMVEGLRTVLRGDCPEFTLEYADFSTREEKWFLFEIRPLEIFNQLGALVMHFDITARKKGEEAAKSFNRVLEQRIAERTQELQMANRELEAFNYTVSHDLQSPLRVVNGFSKILLEEYEGKLDSTGKKYLQFITGSVERMSQLIKDMLAFARVEKLSLRKQEVDMTAIVHEVIAEVKTAQPNITTAFVVRLPAVSISKCDPALIKQVWSNLILNAVKYSGKKEHPVIEVGEQLLNGATVYYVKDNGVGFDMKFADSLFTMFKRLHHEADFEGTGIGLALVHNIITKHNGRIWADAIENEGATFYFTLQ